MLWLVALPYHMRSSSGFALSKLPARKVEHLLSTVKTQIPNGFEPLGFGLWLYLDQPEL
jgi:hypothetical protein